MARLVFALCCALVQLVVPALAFASDMDLALSRLRIVPGNGICRAQSVGFCVDNAAFERLVSELSVAISPPVDRGAAGLATRGFYFGVSSTLTPISAGQRYWTRGTAGDVRGASENNQPDGALVWNRVEARKGLPFGFEIGSSFGQGVDTSLWVFSGELKWALFEGFHSGLGQLPDLAVRGAMQTMLGSRQLSLQTNTFDVTLSKPLVVAQRYRVTPFAAFALLFVNASSGRVDLTSDVDAFAKCAPSAASPGALNTGLSCSKSASDNTNYATFAPVSHMRTRLFFGVETSEHWWTTSASVGLDLTTPQLRQHTSSDGFGADLSRQFSFHLAVGLRY